MAGLSESLMGRFEEIRMTHWSYAEMHEAFGMELDEFMFYGGYPGPAFLLPAEEERWKTPYETPWWMQPFNEIFWKTIVLLTRRFYGEPLS